MSGDNRMISNSEAHMIMAIMKAAGLEELFIPREALADMFANETLYIEEKMDRSGFHIRIGEWNGNT